MSVSVKTDWPRWMEVSEQEREAMVRRYRQQVGRESEDNLARWRRMTPTQRARYPEVEEQA